MRLVEVMLREEMAYSTIAPSIESLLRLPPEAAESWVLGSNPKVNRIARHVERAADVECTVLVSGETGTGKELWARLLHRLGPRRDKPFVPVNCAALTATLAESQLFGHEKGAFTGAAGQSLGVFRAAGFPVEAYPVDWHTFGTRADDLTFFTFFLRGLGATDIAAHEFIGMAMYRLTGRSAALFPAP